VQLFKALIFSFAGLLAGLAGALFAYHQGFIGPASMGPGLSTTAVLYALFGGTGTLIGPVIGTFLIETISYFLADQAQIKAYWPVFLGVILVLVVAFKPTGILGFFVSERERIGSYGGRKGRSGPRG
jgi:branched-chain amino acid transport system permease protein